ncbi:hypothetical protein DPMN_131070 [Dreissena polymorpha]|uniref:Peptidase C76 domain-containing protein n=1 Tax=Dreissena polymorpha TaxID=45954 RepID=A0A9D4HC65_DREPO|nr:hypothetical protein DPMN_131070 [Dreissena polymorpha]
MAYLLVAHGDYCQTDERLPCDARGKQCVPCCMMFLVFVKNVKPAGQIKADDLNHIIQDGSSLYMALNTDDTVSGFVNPQILPDKIVYRGKRVYVEHKDVMSGVIRCSSDIDIEAAGLFSLEIAFTKCFADNNDVILVFAGFAIAIHYERKTHFYYVFDSHSRDENGLCCPDGTSVLGEMHSLKDMCTFIDNLVTSCGQCPTSVQFDMHLFFLKAFFKPYFNAVHILDNQEGFKKIPKRKQANTSVGRKRPCLRDKMIGMSFTGCIDDRFVPDKFVDLPSKFDNLVSEGPDYVCSCCSQNLF